MTTPVSFELAKLLKEKGFNIPCRYQYYTWLAKYEILDNEEDATNEELSIQAKNDGISLDTWITAPTIAEVVMWLYEKYGIWVFVSKTIHSQKWYYTHQINDEREGSWNDYNSLTEAYEAVILHCLTNFM